MSRSFSVPESPELREALRPPPGPALPVIARSLTREEVAAMESRVGRVLFPITLGMLWLFTLVSLFAEDVREMGPVMPLVAIAGTGLIVGVWFWRQKRRRVHCGTPIRVEVREDGIEVLTLHETHLIPFAEAAYTFSTWSGEYLRFFLGIVLDTPVGRLRIEDGYFEHGTDAAEAIMYLCGDTRHLGVPRLTT